MQSEGTVSMAVAVGSFCIGLGVAGVVFACSRPGRKVERERRVACGKDRIPNASSNQMAGSAQKLALSPASTHASTPLHALERTKIAEGATEPYLAAVRERRERISASGLDCSNVPGAENAPGLDAFYAAVHGVCCEMVVGRVSLPVGVAGPLQIHSYGARGHKRTYDALLPLATVEGALVASVNRGAKALLQSGGADVVVAWDAGNRGMTRGPVLEAPDVGTAACLAAHLNSSEHFPRLARVFDATSVGGHVCLRSLRARQLGSLVFVRVRAECGAAMGMNMVSRGCEALLSTLLAEGAAFGFPECRVLAVSGNYCTDKKPSALNWIEGRGRQVVASASLPFSVVQGVLGIAEPRDLARVAQAKCLVGSAAAGSVGGFNAQVANVAAGMFLATGQDAAQVVEASHAMTLVDVDTEQSVVRVSLTMPCVEVGVIGGGTRLPGGQFALLEAMLEGAGRDVEDEDAGDCVGEILAVGALAGEISLLAALTTGTLVRSHMALNRR